jgi:hypothetical protein
VKLQLGFPTSKNYYVVKINDCIIGKNESYKFQVAKPQSLHLLKKTLFSSNKLNGELKANRKLFPGHLQSIFEGALVGARFSINTVICT